MPQTDRLPRLLALLRESPRPVPAHRLAEAVGVSVRTLYRDIAHLKAQGAAITGGPGTGFVLQPAYMVPSMMLTRNEIAALLLGARWVADRADTEIGEAGQGVLARLTEALPEALQEDLSEAGFLTPGGIDMPETHINPEAIHAAIRDEVCVYMTYVDLKGITTERTVWPIAFRFLDHLRILVVWCELRQAFRHFRPERILGWKPLDMRYPKRRYALLKSWREMVRESASPLPEVRNSRMLTGFGTLSEEQ